MHVCHVVGARPNFMKAAPVYHALARHEGVRQTLIHTGQHYDANMSDVFFSQLDIPTPDVNLEVGSSSHAQQTAEVMSRLEPVVLEFAPDVVLVYGDINSTVAAALVCSKLVVPFAHVEAGLRSFDRAMPEEVNRIVTDHLADLLFTPSEDAELNLQREGIPRAKICPVGNVMIDSLIKLLPAAKERALDHRPPYALVTLHRPSNVDDPAALEDLLESLSNIGERLTVLFPVHPRTRQKIAQMNLNPSYIHLLEPLSYVDFLALQVSATVVITDSGGIQEETTYLGVPCLTMRENTERPVTVTMGTNILVGANPERLTEQLNRILQGNVKPGSVPPLWDGHAGERIALTLVQHFGQSASLFSTTDVIAQQSVPAAPLS